MIEISRLGYKTIFPQFQGICQQDPPGRRKREEDRTNVSSVVTSVQVVPRIAGTDPNANDSKKLP